MFLGHTTWFIILDCMYHTSQNTSQNTRQYTRQNTRQNTTLKLHKYKVVYVYLQTYYYSKSVLVNFLGQNGTSLGLDVCGRVSCIKKYIRRPTER